MNESIIKEEKVESVRGVIYFTALIVLAAMILIEVEFSENTCFVHGSDCFNTIHTLNILLPAIIILMILVGLSLVTLVDHFKEKEGK